MDKLYSEFRESYLCAYPDIKKETAYRKLQKMWNNIKRNPNELSTAIVKLKVIIAKRKTSLLTIWIKVATTSSSNAIPDSDTVMFSGRANIGVCCEPSTSSTGDALHNPQIRYPHRLWLKIIIIMNI